MFLVINKNNIFFELFYPWPRVADLFAQYFYHMKNTNNYIMEYILRLLLRAVMTQRLEYLTGQ